MRTVYVIVTFLLSFHIGSVEWVIYHVPWRKSKAGGVNVVADPAADVDGARNINVASVMSSIQDSDVGVVDLVGLESVLALNVPNMFAHIL